MKALILIFHQSLPRKMSAQTGLARIREKKKKGRLLINPAFSFRFVPKQQCHQAPLGRLLQELTALGCHRSSQTPGARPLVCRCFIGPARLQVRADARVGGTKCPT